MSLIGFGYGKLLSELLFSFFSFKYGCVSLITVSLMMTAEWVSFKFYSR